MRPTIRERVNVHMPTRDRAVVKCHGTDAGPLCPLASPFP
jgi:hypothetical protein